MSARVIPFPARENGSPKLLPHGYPSLPTGRAVTPLAPGLWRVEFGAFFAVAHGVVVQPFTITESGGARELVLYEHEGFNKTRKHKLPMGPQPVLDLPAHGVALTVLSISYTATGRPDAVHFAVTLKGGAA